MVNVSELEPQALIAVMVTRNAPASVGVPEINPVD